MTNPNNAVGTNAAYSGRTSANAFNDVLSAFSGRGVLSGWGCVPDTGMTVAVGGNGTERDTAIAEDNAGNFTTVNNISASPISVTLPAAPAANSRVDSIVAYVVKPPVGVSTEADNPQACGLITVSGTVSASPSAPNDTTIRSAITADGAAGNNAYYVVLANVTVGTGVTTITSDAIAAGAASGPAPLTIVAEESSVTSLPLNTFTDIQNLTVPAGGNYKVTVQFSGYSSAAGTYTPNISLKVNGSSVATFKWNSSSNESTVINVEGYRTKVLSLSAGDKVSFAAKIENHSLTVVTPGLCSLVAMKIG